MAEIVASDRLTGPFVAAPGQTDFPADFPLVRASALRIRRVRAGVETVFSGADVLATDETDDGFTAVLSVPCQAGDQIWVYSEIDYSRPRSHVPGGATRTKTLEGDASDIWAMIQELGRDLARAFKAPFGDVGGMLPSSEALVAATAALTTAIALAGSVANSEYSSDAAAKLAQVPAPVAQFRSAGYATPGDFGGGLWVRTLVQPTHPAKLQTADGSWWELKAETYRPQQFGAKADGVTDDTAAIQAAINTTKTVELIGTYRAHGLTGNTPGQAFRAIGEARIVKNANGDLFTHSGRDVVLDGIIFNGEDDTPTYTGHNVVLTGDGPTLVNCASFWTLGRALKATGERVRILGSRSVYFTSDTSADGYCIEIGTTAKRTLYHSLCGFNTSVSYGGILLINPGAHSVTNCQFGKYTVQSAGEGEAFEGRGGGMTTNCRITGNVFLGLSNASLSNNQFGAVSITLGENTSGILLDWTNVYQIGHSITNLGNNANPLIRSVGTGASPTAMVLRFGHSAFSGDWGLETQSGNFFTNRGIRIGNGRAIRARNANDDGDCDLVTMFGANNNVFLGHTGGAAGTTVACGTGVFSVYQDAATRLQVGSSFIRPGADNASSCGSTSFRWTQVFAATGTIGTSDEREKRDISAIYDAILDAWAEVDWCQFRWNEAVDEKGDAARIHFGVIAQRVRDAFEAHELDGFRYGVLCWDRWDEHEIVDWVEVLEPEVRDEDDNLIKAAVLQEHKTLIPAGDRMGVRYDQASALEAALNRRERALDREQIETLRGRVAALESHVGIAA